MISAILIYGRKGEILASRIYKSGIRKTITDAFRVEVVANSVNTPPVVMLGSTSFLHIKYNSMYVVAVTRFDVDSLAVFEFLHKLCHTLSDQLNGFDESACYKFVTRIYEILDELVDSGFPQDSEMSLLEEPHEVHVTSADIGVVSSLKRTLTTSKPRMSRNNSQSQSQRSISPTTPKNGTMDIPWRTNSVKHRRNEVYLDVIENLNVMFNPDGSVVSSTVDGVVVFKSQLSGVPKCQISFNQVYLLENCHLHTCVDHTKFHNSGMVAFIPPEGKFDLLTYHVTKNLDLPLTIRNHRGQDHVIKVTCDLEAKHHLQDITILVPVKLQILDQHKPRVSNGKVKYVPDKEAFEWKASRLSGGNEMSMSLPSVHSHGPISAKFMVSMYTCSQTKVLSLKVVEDSKYSTVKWVRYETRAASCEARVQSVPESPML